MRNEKKYPPTKDFKGSRKGRAPRAGQSKEDGMNGSIPGHNDWSWYAPTETIAREIASIPFNCITGTNWPNSQDTASIARNPESAGNFTINTFESQDSASGVANVLTFNYILNYGDSKLESTNGINMAAKQLYTYIRKSNSGAKVYEAPDVMMYVCAMREIYALYFKLKKILGLVKFYSNVNRSVPSILLRANGISAEEFDVIRANYAIYRGELNLAAEKLNSFAMPKYFKVFMRDAFLQSYIFSDSTSLSGQFYNFNLYAIRQWSATESTSGTSLIPILVPNTFKEILTLLNTSLNIMFDDTDVNTIAGDILKAFGDGDLYRVLETTEDYTCVPIYDEDVLNQIQNAYYIGFANSTLNAESTGMAQLLSNSFKITQDSNNIVTHHRIAVIDLYNWAPVGSPASIPAYHKYLFNSHKDSPAYTDVLEWSRLSQVINLESGEGAPGQYHLRSVEIVAGAELILGSTILLALGSDEDLVSETSFAPVGSNGGSFLIRQFDWHPTLYTTAHNNFGQFITYGGDVKKCTLISRDILMRMHDCALYSLFNAKSLDIGKSR